MPHAPKSHRAGPTTGDDAPNSWADAASVALASLAGLLAALGVAGLIVLYWGCK